MKLVLLLLAAIVLVKIIEKIYEWIWNKHLKISIQFQEQPAVEGETAILTETVENEKWMPVPILQVEFLVDNGLSLGDEENASKSDKQYKRDVFSVSFFQRIHRTISFTCEKRGYYEINQVNLTTRGIRMQDIYYKDQDIRTYLYVYPRKILKQHMEFPLRRLGGMLERKKAMIEDPFAFAGLREYDMSDPMNRINWKASARNGELMVNIQNSTYSAKIICFLDMEDATLWKHDEVHEEEIRLTATLLGEYLKKAVPAAVYSNGYDCMNLEESKVNMGSGKGQVEKLNRMLSRINLKDKRKVRPITEIIKEQKKELLEQQPVLLLITENHNEELNGLMAEFAQKGVAVLWLAANYQEDFWKGPGHAKISFVQWEVKHEG